MARKSRRKKAEAEAQQTTANAAGLTLLGLPVEIRMMILRLVVGDQLIRPSSSDYEDSKQQLGLEVFAINRQLHREAFPLFWRTSRFYFNTAAGLEIYLDRLTESQKTNLTNLALNVTCSCYNSRPHKDEQLYWDIRRRWPSCALKNADTHPWRSLESLELHLGLNYYSTKVPPARQLGAVHAALRALANLRFAHLKQAQVTIGLTDMDAGENDTGESLTTGELVAIAASFQLTLLDPVVTKEDHTRFLTDEVHELEVSLGKEKNKFSGYMRQAPEVSR